MSKLTTEESEGIMPTNRAPREAIERRKEFALEARLEATGELMSKVLEIAQTASSGREIKECAVAWGVLCDKSAIMEGLPANRTETHTSSSGPGVGKMLNLEEEFRALDDRLEEELEEELAQGEDSNTDKEYGAGSLG